MHTDEWAVVAARHLFDDIMSARDAVGVAIMLTFAFETGFSNLQFLGLAADAAKAGDMVFSNLASSIQTDEARHAQIGGPVVKILIENGHQDNAQRLVDIAIWRAWTLFATVTGPSMDYYTPLERRQQSFKEFMLEWVFGQFERTLVDIGLDRPWYWDIMLDDLDTRHHGMHAGIWTFHQSVWWDVPPGVSPAEREWLEEKYPGWEETWGAHFWEPIIERFVADGPVETVLPTMIPLCNMSQVPVTGTPGWTPGKTGRPLKDYPLEHKGRTYHFGSEVDRWIFQQDPERYQDHLSVADRMVAGMIQPPTLRRSARLLRSTPGRTGRGRAQIQLGRSLPPGPYRGCLSGIRRRRVAHIPLVHNLHDEFVLYLSVVDTDNTMDEVCEMAAALSIGFDKNKRADRPLRVRALGATEPFPPDMTVAQAGLSPMSSIELYYE